MIRVDGTYQTWAPAAVAMIGRPPATIEDRAISVRMKRRRPDEKIEALRLDRMEEFTPLANIAARWAIDHTERLKDADATVPVTLQNREADNWRPLLAIADIAGGDWPTRARRVAESVALSNRDSEQSVGIALLADILLYFNSQPNQRVASAELVGFLSGLDGRPWGEWKIGKPITAKAIANVLAPFRIAPAEMRVGQRILRGLCVPIFDSAWT